MADEALRSREARIGRAAKGLGDVLPGRENPPAGASVALRENAPLRENLSARDAVATPGETPQRDALPAPEALPPLDETAALRAEVAALRRQLVQSQKLGTVGALAASVAHEFNNILTTIINYSKMGMRHKDDATRDKAFDRMLTAGQRAAKITQGMLAYARPGQDRREVVDLAQLVDEVLLLTGKDLQMHRVRWQVDVFDRPQVAANGVQIQQVLVNLIVNARQAMAQGGQLVLTVRSNAETGFAEVAVKDTGPGIAADRLPRIFDPFYSTKTADENGQGGSGLGLAVCREIVESHHGRIRVESAPGRGTTFTLKLPQVAAPALRPSDRPSAAASSTTGRTANAASVPRAG